MLKAYHVQIVSTVKVGSLCNEGVAVGSVSNDVMAHRQRSVQVNDKSQRLPLRSDISCRLILIWALGNLRGNHDSYPPTLSKLSAPAVNSITLASVTRPRF